MVDFNNKIPSDRHHLDWQQTLGKYKVNFTGRMGLSGYQTLPKFLTLAEIKIATALKASDAPTSHTKIDC